jgi:hypothetical protein
VVANGNDIPARYDIDYDTPLPECSSNLVYRVVTCNGMLINISIECLYTIYYSEDLSVASLLGGLCLANAKLGAVHG